ncbi:DUF2188 domain-containing protein [Devosia sp. PTR5]|uniref:DUF2188 domain-containing protein n=1 Tax=Devosia oryzisoli TaxID=2774138 RepID=A0A927FSW2_9HYPH|nr:DUF2188 domain-containing protein [Devosia oryzisoli]MBD8064544.1 DUF2188 domain-containing protein [Devosia oryzisoli]
MSERHFIVHQSDAGWQYTFMGTITGPFKSRQDAIDAAIEAARGEDSDCEVVVQDSDMRRETVWRADRKG